MWTRRRLVAHLGAGGLGAGLAGLATGCSQNGAAPPVAAPIEGTLEWAVQGPWRLEPERDAARRPIETLRFFGLQSNQTVLEVYPGRGWWTSILGPYLKQGGGALIVATFDPATSDPAAREQLAAFNARFNDSATFGVIQRATLSAASAPLTARGRCDLALIMRNLHTFMAQGWAEKALADVFTALKPGGVLGIEQHRAPSTGVQDPTAGTGYVQEAYVRALCAEAGFEFVGGSELNANPKDTRDHPFGVWTLPPVLRTSPLGAPEDPSFDTAKYREIGESDRMTLKFRKPAAGRP